MEPSLTEVDLELTCILDGVWLDEYLLLDSVDDHGAPLGAEGVETENKVTGPLSYQLALTHCEVTVTRHGVDGRFIKFSSYIQMKESTLPQRL